MKTLYLFIVVMGLFALSCNDMEEENFLDYQQAQEELLSYVTFENNRYVFNLTEQEAARLNIDLTIYQELARKIQVANDTLANVESKGIEIIYVDSLTLEENTFEEHSRYLIENYTTTGEVSATNPNWGESQLMFCNGMRLAARSDSVLWGVQVVPSIGESFMLVGKNRLPVSKSVFKMVDYFPITQSAYFTYLYGPGPISCSITPYSTMEIKIEEDPMYRLTDISITLKATKTTSGSFNLEIKNNNAKSVWIIVRQNSGGAEYRIGELKSGNTTLRSFKLPGTYDLYIYDRNPNPDIFNAQLIGSAYIYSSTQG